MYGARAFSLIKDLARTADSTIPPFDETTLRLIFDEMDSLYEQNQHDTSMSAIGGNASIIPGLYLRHTSLERNQQCVLAYLYNRLTRIRDIRWSSGSILPESVRSNITEQEKQFFQSYNKLLANYMRTIGDTEGGLDLTNDVSPPKGLMTQVLVLKDWELQLETGDFIYLKKDTIHSLPNTCCEPLIRQNVLEYLGEREQQQQQQPFDKKEEAAKNNSQFQ